ncbi:MAG: sensor histidine kinase [Chlorobi bacterium]|nr:sensor histidine kinase [Chlorobiota bacterium]
MSIISTDEHKKLIKENSNQKSELEALRRTINALRDRSNELQTQKIDLENKVNVLAKGKDEVENSQKQKDALFAVLIHDMINPAGMIKNLVELLFHYKLDTEEQQDIINDIFKTTATIVTLSKEISRVMDLETGELILNISNINIRETISASANKNQSAADKKKIKIKIEIEHSLPEIQADQSMVEEIIENLVSNAIKYTQETGEIILQARRESDKEIIVEILDNGQGLSQEDIEKAFVRGAKLSPSPTAGEPSSGLGLWVVKKLVDGHNGRVRINSSPGKGSNFAFILPIESEKIK